jgi:hypothetical protein
MVARRTLMHTADLTTSSLTWAKALNALKTSSTIEVAAHFVVSLEQLQNLLSNAENIHQNYPRRGKHLPLIPNFPRISDSVVTSKQKKHSSISARVFTMLCKKFDISLEAGNLTLGNIRLGMEILKYAVPGKDYALRCPDEKTSRLFLRLCQLLGLKARHLKFRYHNANLAPEKSSLIQTRWKKTLIEHGFSDTNFVVASESEGLYLGKHDGNGFLEIALVNSKYKRVQRLVSFLHLLLILSFNAEL